MRNSWTRLNVGLVTSSSLAAPRPLIMPLVSVVLPLPRSPFNSTRTGGRSFDAISRPLAMVSSEECVTNSLAGTFPLREDTRVRFRDRVDQIGSDQGRFPNARCGDVTSEAVQVHAEAEHARPILNAKLRGQAGKIGRAHIAGSASRHSGITCRVDVGVPRGRRQNGMETFEDHMRAPAASRFEGNVQAARLHFFHGDAKKARHF